METNRQSESRETARRELDLVDRDFQVSYDLALHGIDAEENRARCAALIARRLELRRMLEREDPDDAGDKLEFTERPARFDADYGG